MKKAVVLLSGGIDSATCLALARQQGYTCYALSIDYGQRQRYELICAAKIAQAVGVKEHQQLQVNLPAISHSALTDKNIAVPERNLNLLKVPEIPVTYVPARNTIFLSLALGWAETVGALDIVIGANREDFIGYPDCRAEYYAAFETLATLATKMGVEGGRIHIETPLIDMSKAEIIQLGSSLGVDYSLTSTCYQPGEQGQACGRCDSCLLRRRGFVEAGVMDPAIYVSV